MLTELDYSFTMNSAVEEPRVKATVEQRWV